MTPSPPSPSGRISGGPEGSVDCTRRGGSGIDGPGPSIMMYEINEVYKTHTKHVVSFNKGLFSNQL